MAKYKYLGGNAPEKVKDQIYDGSFKRASYCHSVEELAKLYPNEWELIEGPMQEKTIKLSLNQARKMYGKNPEMDELLLANFSKDELIKKELPTKFEQLSKLKGYVISSDTSVLWVQAERPAYASTRNIFFNSKIANSALAMAQLSQLMAVYNDGWEADWGNNTQSKYVISRKCNKIMTETLHTLYYFLAFKSAEIRDEFLKNFEPLIKEYFMI